MDSASIQEVGAVDMSFPNVLTRLSTSLSRSRIALLGQANPPGIIGLENKKCRHVF